MQLPNRGSRHGEPGIDDTLHDRPVGAAKLDSSGAPRTAEYLDGSCQVRELILRLFDSPCCSQCVGCALKLGKAARKGCQKAPCPRLCWRSADRCGDRTTPVQWR